MGRKIFGWILAGLSIFQFVIFILILFDGIREGESRDSYITILIDTFVSSLLSMGYSLYFFNKKKDVVKISAKDKVIKVVYHIVFIMAVFSCVRLRLDSGFFRMFFSIVFLFMMISRIARISKDNNN